MNHKEVYYIFDDPIPFKGLLFYPIRMRNYLELMTFSDCLTIDKNSIPDVKIISMSYLDYLLTYTDKDNLWIAKLDRILRLSLNEKDEKIDIQYGYDDNKKPIIKIGESIINSTDFDEIVNIICDQNMIEQEDYTVSKEVRDALKSAREFKSKGGSKMGNLEDQVLCIVSSTAMTIEDISNMTVRKFLKLLQRVDNKLHYQIYLSASMSGMVEFKDKSFIKHWMSDLEGDKFGGNLIDRESIDKKLSGDR
jgi:uncharacterized Fe-S cluster-containing radical SAM superfamily enzyme